jgi:CheY-like chemotaxis protein
VKLNGEIILIDNDDFEKDFLKEALKLLNYDIEVVYLPTANAGFDYLKKTQKEIFLIISEIDFDEMGGLDLKKIINKEPNTKWKSIPFVFIANTATKEIVQDAYKHNIQGFFRKPTQFKELTDMFSVIIRYWIMNFHPSTNDTFYVR